MTQESHEGSEPRAERLGRAHRLGRGCLAVLWVVVGLASAGPDRPTVVFAPGTDQGKLLAVSESFEDDCRACHDQVPDRHHVLFGQPVVEDSVIPFPDGNGDGAPDGVYVCLSCHGPNFVVERNCVACHASPVGSVPDGTSLAEDPLTVSVTASRELRLTWGRSCEVGDTDYAVYEGVLRDFSTHVPRTCSTDAAMSAIFPAPPANAYYLIVPRNHWSEGSYGVNSHGAQRPASVSPCLPQSIGCP